MMFGVCCQRERLCKFLYIVQIFILAGIVYYCFQGKTAPDRKTVGELSQPIGETLRPVWGPMDKCYPVTIQVRHGVKSVKKQASEAMAPKAMGRLHDAAPTEKGILSQEGERRSPREKAASAIPAGKEVAEEEVADTPGCEGNEKVQSEAGEYPFDISEVESKEKSLGGWVPQLLRKLVLAWSPASNIPKTQNHE